MIKRPRFIFWRRLYFGDITVYFRDVGVYSGDISVHFGDLGGNIVDEPSLEIGHISKFLFETSLTASVDSSHRPSQIELVYFYQILTLLNKN